MSEAKGRYRVVLRTVVSLTVEVEAGGLGEAVEEAARRVRPGAYFDGNGVAEDEGVAVEWAEEHAYAYVDDLTRRMEVPATYEGPWMELRTHPESGWRQVVEPEYAAGAAT